MARHRRARASGAALEAARPARAPRREAPRRHAEAPVREPEPTARPAEAPIREPRAVEPKPAPRRERRHREEELEAPVAAFGDHMPDFLRRPVRLPKPTALDKTA